MIFKHLSMDERGEYHAAMQRACYDEAGLPRPTRELGERVRKEFERAEQSGRTWPRWALEDAAETALKTEATRYIRSRSHTDVAFDGDRTVSRPTIYALRGSSGYKPTPLGSMNAEQLAALVNADDKRTESSVVTASMHRRLLELVERRPEVASLNEALAAEGKTLSEFLMERAA